MRYTSFLKYFVLVAALLLGSQALAQSDEANSEGAIVVYPNGSQKVIQPGQKLYISRKQLYLFVEWKQNGRLIFVPKAVEGPGDGAREPVETSNGCNEGLSLGAPCVTEDEAPEETEEDDEEPETVCRPRGGLSLGGVFRPGDC